MEDECSEVKIWWQLETATERNANRGNARWRLKGNPRGNFSGWDAEEAAHRTALAKGEVEIREKKPVLTLAQFISEQFMPWASATFKAKRNTFVWYRGGARRLSEFEAIATARLDQITGEKVAAYVAHRQAAGLNTTAINRELQILRRMLHLAIEWGQVKKSVKIRMLPGEPRRERALTSEESARYLSAAAEPLVSVASVLIDGLRPEECFRLRWEYIDFMH